MHRSSYLLKLLQESDGIVMTLEERLNQLLAKKSKKPLLVKIGSKQGISFFYCDTLSNKTFIELGKISNKYLARMKAELKVKVDRMVHFDTYWEQRIANIRKIESEEYRNKVIEDTPKHQRLAKKRALEKKLKELPQVLEKNYKQREKEKISIPNRIKQLEKEIPLFTSLLTRQVQEEYKSISLDEPNCLIIRIKGKEKGDYWSVIEYQDRDLPTLLKRRYGWQNKQ